MSGRRRDRAPSGRLADFVPTRGARALAARSTGHSAPRSRSLIASQSPDGAWRSPTYGVFKDGLSLTPIVLKAVTFGPDVAGSAIRAAPRGRLPDRSSPGRRLDRRRSVRHDVSGLHGLGRRDRPDAPQYPGQPRGSRRLAPRLRRRQLTEALGWEPGDPAFGGWGYSIEPPSKGDAVLAPAHPIDADLSSTLFAIGALRIAGMRPTTPRSARL